VCLPNGSMMCVRQMKILSWNWPIICRVKRRKRFCVWLPERCRKLSAVAAVRPVQASRCWTSFSHNAQYWRTRACFGISMGEMDCFSSPGATSNGRKRLWWSCASIRFGGYRQNIVALHRAVFLSRSNPDARVLLTTFSNTLANALRIRMRRLISNSPRLVKG